MHYLRDLANDFHTYYSAHQFIVEEAALRDARLALALARRPSFATDSACWACPRPIPCRPGQWRRLQDETRTARWSFSGWAGLLCGLLAGLAVAGLVYIRDHRPEPRSAPSNRKEKGPWRHTVSGTTRLRGGGEPAKSYDFYDMLPKFEVVVPEKEKDVKPDIGRPPRRAAAPTCCRPAPSNFADADRVRAQLALQGIESKVQKVSVDSDTWHRIRIGPISDLDELNRMRQQLRKADVDVLVIRVGD